MKKYEVCLKNSFYYYVTVEANSSEEAEEIALEKDIEDMFLDDEEWEFAYDTRELKQ